MRKFFNLSSPEGRRAAKMTVEVIGWLVAILLFIYASHAAFALSRPAAPATTPAATRPKEGSGF